MHVDGEKAGGGATGDAGWTLAHRGSGGGSLWAPISMQTRVHALAYSLCEDERRRGAGASDACACACSPVLHYKPSKQDTLFPHNE